MLYLRVNGGVDERKAEVMASRLLGLLLWFMPWIAFAQKAADEAPVEPANPVAVVLFVIVFIGSCIGFVAYVWWKGRGKPREKAADEMP